MTTQAVTRVTDDFVPDEGPVWGPDGRNVYFPSSRGGGMNLWRVRLGPDGEPAGVSQLMASRLRPYVGRQGDTGVLSAHRGHALGRWLKAENLRRALTHQPGIEVIETYNAESNPHMLAINVEMGFRPHRSFSTWQGPVAAAAETVGVDLP